MARFNSGNVSASAAGTANAIAKFTGANLIGNSSITDDGTTVKSTEAVNIGSAQQFIVNVSGLPTKSNAITLTDQGFPLEVASQSLTAQAAAVTNTINYTPAAAAGIYEVVWTVDTTTATTDSFTVVITWKNATGTARSQNSGGFDINGTGLVAGAITNTIGAGAYYGSMVIQIDNSATAITLSTAGTFTTVTYNLAASLRILK